MVGARGDSTQNQSHRHGSTAGQLRLLRVDGHTAAGGQRGGRDISAGFGDKIQGGGLRFDFVIPT
ncbi:MAG: hypothetical protein NW226_07135 [Microscillaceae bacterium]|nr:hypothetical protein [Microscillaceae bacterium]